MRLLTRWLHKRRIWRIYAHSTQFRELSYLTVILCCQQTSLEKKTREEELIIRSYNRRSPYLIRAVEINIIVDNKQMRLLARKVKMDKTFSCLLEKITNSRTSFKVLLDKIHVRRVSHK